MNVITERPLTDLLTRIVDNRGRTCPTAETGIPLIATNCIKDEHLYPVFENVRYVDPSTYSTWFRGHPESGDIVFVCKGSPGRVALVPDPVSFCIAQDMVALRANPAIVNNRYLYYLLSATETQRKIENMHVGTMIPHFKKGDFPKLLLPVHEDLAAQERIVEVLGAIDDKIVANNKLITSVDALAEAQFQSVLHDAQPNPLSGLAEFINGKAFTKGASGTGRVVVRIAELNSGIGKSTVFSDAEVDDKHVARPGDILFAWSGSLTLHRWFREEAIVNQHIFKVIPTVGTPPWLIYELLRNKLNDFKMIAANKATTMGHIQRKHLDEPVLVPTKISQQKIALGMESLWETALITERENQTLATLRDTLLPQFISGKLHVKDAEALVESVM